MHNDERLFWRTMTPHRCAVLYREYFARSTPRHAAPAPAPEKPQPSLYALVTGKGG